MQVAKLGGIDRLEQVAVPTPEPGRRQVRVAVSAAGVNFADLLMIAGQYQVAPELPFSPGFEAAGIVEAVGEDVTRFAVGSRVVATPWFGAYAEHVVVDESACEPLPDDLAFETAAALPVAFGTALHALRNRGALQPGETLLVTGATGGTGSAAVRLGKLMGARVIAAVGSADKVPLAEAMGADTVVVYGGATRLRDLLRSATGDAGIDVAFDPVGGDLTEEALRAAAWGGRILVVGFASGAIPQIPANLPLLKGASVVGVFWGRWRTLHPAAAHDQFAELTGWVATGRLDPGISVRYPLEAAGEALRAVAERKVAGKVVLTI